jgi:hypothetical protein
LGYLLTAAVVVLVAAAAAGAMYVRNETRPADGPPGGLVRKVVRRVVPGDRCRCGGTVGSTSGESGDLLGCTGCDRWWTLEGRRIIQR